MVVDDVGWADVSYHGGNFSTPNIDRLATKEGVRLEKYYVQQCCSPTRSALMTGRYPFHTGMQHWSTFAPGSTAGIPKDVPTIAEALRKAGYSTHAVGKWHLGSSSWSDTPTGRGFDSHLGYLQGATDYYNHTFGSSIFGMGHHGKLGYFSGYDFWANQTAVWEYYGQYSTDPFMAEARRVLDTRDTNKPFFLYFAHQLIHQPLELPPTHYAACDRITSDLPDGKDRHTLCSMMVELDTQIGVFESWLKQDGLWNNTVVWVTTDNGGMTIGLKDQPPFGIHTKTPGPYSVSSNYPLRAGKISLFEGGVRGVSFVTGGFLPSRAHGAIRSGLLQHVDIPTTLAALGGAGSAFTGVDGYDVWNYILSGGVSPRTEVPVNIDNCFGLLLGGPPCSGKHWHGLIQGNWKYISGPEEAFYDGWWSNDPYTFYPINATSGPAKIDGTDVFLFDLSKDESEHVNVAAANPHIVEKMRARCAELGDKKNGYRNPETNIPHLRATPPFHNGTWAPWQHFIEFV